MWNKILKTHAKICHSTHAHTQGFSLLMISVVPISLARCKETFTPPTGPGTCIWDHLQSTICFSTNPTCCLVCAICHRNTPPCHGHHHKPFRGLPYPCMTFTSHPHTHFSPGHLGCSVMLSCSFSFNRLFVCILTDLEDRHHWYGIWKATCLVLIETFSDV